MEIIFSIDELQTKLAAERQAGKRIGFVPTMGNLHGGHIALVSQAKESADCIVASIYVNPLQFGLNEDLDNYPRTLEADKEKLIAAGCHYLFVPTDDEVYPHGRAQQTEVEVPEISDMYCGASRPGHFRGVATVVCKLFGIVRPDLAVFGEKDFQQLMVIRRMTEDLYLPVEIQGSPTKREASGLAMSSRNGYLTAEEKAKAAALFKTLTETAQALKEGATDYTHIQEHAQTQLEKHGFKRDYFAICNRNTLQPANADTTAFVILAAAHLGKARLIDNITVDR
ncbi:MAG: pantoate--beta-alanine ligase [Pontibacterium sp.]